MIIDFHTHTHHSYDSLMRPARILALAKKRGLNGIVICDHNTIKGGMEVQALNEDPQFKVIVGAEILTDAGDITGIFLTREIVSRTFGDVVREIREQGGKVILNHPYKAHDLSKVDYAWIDYVEGYNGRLSWEDNAKAIQLAQMHHLPVVAGSDAHVYGEIGNCRTQMDSWEHFMPVHCDYRRASQLSVTASQYVKGWKRKSPYVFYASSAVFAKHYLRKWGLLKEKKGG